MSGKARIAGGLYLAASVVGVVRLLYIPNLLFVDGNAMATAANIAANEMLFRLGIGASLVAAVLWLFVPLALYRVLSGVHRGVAVVMVILGSLMQVPFYFSGAAVDATALAVARGGQYAAAFDEPQRAAMVGLLLELHHHLDLANLVFAGLWLFPFGWLVYRSGFLPRVLGVWLLAAGVAWLVFSFAGLVYPGYANTAYSITQPVALGEVAMMLWLVVRGANESRAIPSPA